MVAADTMSFGRFTFAIEAASFRFVSQSWSGPGWDFTFRARCINDDAREPLFPFGASLFTEAAPMPLAKAEDYTGTELELPLPYDEETGEPLFGLNVMEEHPVSKLRLAFAERDGNRYRIEITATISPTVLGNAERLELSAWTEELADHAYPV
jgi:hypothetical protein